MNKPAIGSSLPDEPNGRPVLWMEMLGEDNCIVPAAPLVVRYEVNPPLIRGAENASNGRSIDIGGPTG